MSRGMSGHQSARSLSVEWFTPPEILSKLGIFDMDVATSAERPWDTALTHLTANEDGLDTPWRGRVWCNPPYGVKAYPFMRRMRDHGDGIACIPARTETRLWFECVWGFADAVCFVRGRPHFHHLDGSRADGNSGCPIALIAYGAYNAEMLRRSHLGWVVDSR